MRLRMGNCEARWHGVCRHASVLRMQDLKEMLRISACETFRGSVDRPNLFYSVSPDVLPSSGEQCHGCCTAITRTVALHAQTDADHARRAAWWHLCAQQDLPHTGGGQAGI